MAEGAGGCGTAAVVAGGAEQVGAAALRKGVWTGVPPVTAQLMQDIVIKSDHKVKHGRCYGDGLDTRHGSFLPTALTDCNAYGDRYTGLVQTDQGLGSCLPIACPTCSLMNKGMRLTVTIQLCDKPSTGTLLHDGMGAAAWELTL